MLRLCTADGSEFLISLNTKQDLTEWIDTINFVAACLSCPPIDTPSTNTKRKKYPLKTVLPMNSTTKYQFKEQLNDHESRRIRINEEIQEITQLLRLNYDLVGKKAKNTVLQMKYLKHEVRLVLFLMIICFVILSMIKLLNYFLSFFLF